VRVDDDLAIVGSANTDMRSLFSSYELALVVSSLGMPQRAPIGWSPSWLAASTSSRQVAAALLESVTRRMALLE
jgi:phosphatidylserine/phosphatidylglycerophosphate/cardiolipin synthase-like enzyme